MSRRVKSDLRAGLNKRYGKDFLLKDTYSEAKHTAQKDGVTRFLWWNGQSGYKWSSVEPPCIHLRIDPKH